MLTRVLRGVLADLSSVENLPMAQARPKRNRPEEDTADASESGKAAAIPAASLHAGRSYPSNYSTGISPRHSGLSSKPLPVPTSMEWPLLPASFAETSQAADTRMTVSTSALSMNNHEHASLELDPAHQGTLANIPSDQSSNPRLPEPSPALQAGNGHQQELAETYIPFRAGAQQGFYDSMQRGLTSVDSVPLLHSTPSNGRNPAQDLPSMFDLSTLDVPDAGGDLPGVSTHTGPPDTQ